MTPCPRALPLDPVPDHFDHPLGDAALVTTLLTSRGRGTGEVLGQGLAPVLTGTIVALIAGVVRRKVDSALWAYAAATVILGGYGIVRNVFGLAAAGEPRPTAGAAELDNRENGAELQACRASWSLSIEREPS